MPDIAMCKGKGCKLKKKCLRFTAAPNELRQSYFAEPPMETNNSCTYLIPNGENNELRRKVKRTMEKTRK
jgi:hypothetical protein